MSPKPIFNIYMEWDNIAFSNLLTSVFKKYGMTNKKGESLGNSRILGTSNEGHTAFIIEGFDLKKKFGLIVELPNHEKSITIKGGRFNDNATIKMKYAKKFNNLKEASDYLMLALREYESLGEISLNPKCGLHCWIFLKNGVCSECRLNYRSSGSNSDNSKRKDKN